MHCFESIKFRKIVPNKSKNEIGKCTLHSNFISHEYSFGNEFFSQLYRKPFISMVFFIHKLALNLNSSIFMWIGDITKNKFYWYYTVHRNSKSRVILPFPFISHFRRFSFNAYFISDSELYLNGFYPVSPLDLFGIVFHEN